MFTFPLFVSHFDEKPDIEAGETGGQDFFHICMGTDILSGSLERNQYPGPSVPGPAEPVGQPAGSGGRVLIGQGIDFAREVLKIYQYPGNVKEIWPAWTG